MTAPSESRGGATWMLILAAAAAGLAGGLALGWAIAVRRRGPSATNDGPEHHPSGPGPPPPAADAADLGVETVVRLAGGVAHDFNNLLQGMLSLVQLLKTRSGSRPEIAVPLHELETYVEQAGQISRKLLAFSRGQQVRAETLDLGRLVARSTDSLRRLMPDCIALDATVDSRPALVRADPGQLEQVLTNLVLNAVEAMPRGGRIAIRVAVGDDVVLEVEDSGPGIAEEIRERIFEPFVTTKSEGHGIGLGLSVVHGIIASHGGLVEVGTGSAGGALFRVVLPQVSGEREPPSSERDQPAPDGRLAHEMILLVEDEPAARDGLDELLQMLGHGVAAVGDVAGAVDVWQRHGPFDLVLSDYLLPDGTGLELIDRCRRDAPGLPAILMSGYVQDDVIEDARRGGGIVFLQKPFGLDRLREALEELSRARR